MSNFPNSFVERVEKINFNIGQRGNSAIMSLKEKGYTVATGLTEYFAGAISVMAYQNHIREYCPNDSSEYRFASLDSTEKWLQKNGGRAMFLLLRGSENKAELEGYGWTGRDSSILLPDHPITSAFRVGERAVGKGIARDFIQIVVSGTNTLYSNGEGIGLQTWRSNEAANLYYRVGFEFVADAPEDEFRPSLASTNPDGMVIDRRLFMAYSKFLLS